MLEHILILTYSLGSTMGSTQCFPSHFTLDHKNSNKTTQNPTNSPYRVKTQQTFPTELKPMKHLAVKTDFQGNNILYIRSTKRDTDCVS